VPLSLNPDGAYSVGIKVGRRSMDVLLVDFTGAVRQRWTLDYASPTPTSCWPRSAPAGRDAPQAGPRAWRLVQGVGIAAPMASAAGSSCWAAAPSWPRAGSGGPARRGGRPQRLPVLLMKDTAAACVAELVAGRGRSVKSFLYVFVDTFIGGGLVLDSHLRAGLPPATPAPWARCRWGWPRRHRIGAGAAAVAWPRC
jgi:predicted NBD/HSP70 family sugar kinase